MSTVPGLGFQEREYQNSLRTGRRSFYLPPSPTGRAGNPAFHQSFRTRQQALLGGGVTAAPPTGQLGATTTAQLPQVGQDAPMDPMSMGTNFQGSLQAGSNIRDALGGLFGPSNSSAIANMGLTSSIAPEIGSFGAAGFSGGGFGGGAALLGETGSLAGTGAAAGGLNLGAGTALTAALPAGEAALAGAPALAGGAELASAGPLAAMGPPGWAALAAIAIFSLGMSEGWFD